MECREQELDHFQVKGTGQGINDSLEGKRESIMQPCPKQGSQDNEHGVSERQQKWVWSLRRALKSVPYPHPTALEVAESNVALQRPHAEK